MHWVPWIALAISLCAAPAAAAESGCGASEPVATFRSQPALLAAEAGTATVVEWHADGCVLVTLPRQDVAPGRHLLRLAPDAQAAYRSVLDDSGIAAFDAGRVRQALQARPKTVSADGRVHYVRVTDESILELVLHRAGGAKAGTRVRYASLRQDLLNAPGQQDLEALLAVDTLFREMAQHARAAALEVQP